MKTSVILSLCILFVVFLFSSHLFAQQSTVGPTPPEGTYRGKVDKISKAQVIISGVPSYLWQHGCGPTALGMVIGYYDGQGYSDLIDGDASTQTTGVNDAIANDEHYNDYSLPLDYYPNLLPDASELGNAHTSNCMGDFMKTSWSSENNYYGWSWSNDIGPAFIEYINMINSNYITNTSYEYYSDVTSWNLYKNEIDNNRPVVLLVDSDGNGGTDHFVTGIGYDDTSEEYAIYDTWDNSIHWYEWREISTGVVWGIWGFNLLNIEPIELSLDLTVNLEGPFNGIDMNTDLNSILPLEQPYNTVPFNYDGGEFVITIPNADIVDWILVELRDAPDASSATTSTTVDRRAAFLLNNGSIVGMDGASLLQYNISVVQQLFVVIWHRNHLAVMSSGPLTEAGGIYSWDFTDLQAKAYLDGQKDIGGGKFGMIGGDCNSSGRVNTIDVEYNWSREAGNAGYYQGDANMDSQVNNIDKNEIWYPNNGEIVQLPEGVIFYCGAEMEDERDGQFYNTVLIGDQCWMAENLNIGDRIDGINDQLDNATLEKYCYDDLETNCDTYGGLYLWDEMMEYTTTPGTQGI